ncbi:MAG TPA: hypothetical protein VGJ62_06285 [Gemmatimonadaceae bacterium]|jgi:hypothetical protein
MSLRNIWSYWRQRPAITFAAILLVLVASWIYVRRPQPAQPATVLVKGTRTGNEPKRLIVYAHSIGRGFVQSRGVLERLVREPELAGSDLLLFEPRAGRLSTGPADRLASLLRAQIDAQWVRAGGYDDVILAGSSLGSLLIRQAYLTSAGAVPNRPTTVPWSDRVSRIVLLAGLGRGINIENEGEWKWVLRVGRYVPLIRESLVYDQLRGAEFITGIRIAWIRYFDELNHVAANDTTRHVPVVVQLLGTEDSFVRHEDNIDFDQFPNAFHIDVPGARHEVLWLGTPAEAEIRYPLYREAFVSRALPHANPRHQTVDSVDRVVFLLHGIRSSRDGWVKELATTLRSRMPRAEIVQSSYGQISVLGFALPSVRRRKRLWLQDQYTEYLARHPSATFDVVAHSNGTYLVGESLASIPVMRFDRIALLSSVLPKDYPWRERHQLGQAGTVLSERADGDVIGAVVSNALHGLGMSDVGSSGWSGFDEAGDYLFEPPWIAGGHSATVDRANLPSVAEFIVDGRVMPIDAAADPRLSTTLRIAAAVAPWIVFFAAALLVALGFYWVKRTKPAKRLPRIATLTVIALVLAVLLDIL